MKFKCDICGKEYDSISAAQACEKACEEEALAAADTGKEEWLIDYIKDYERLVNADKKEVKEALEKLYEDRQVLEKAICTYKDCFDNYCIGVREDNDSYKVIIEEYTPNTIDLKKKTPLVSLDDYIGFFKRWF